ncbi:MAG TPA: hypothetical protein VFD03_00180 [Clostridia bacterium]|nr:hypothetical protein [Clostridia bacterium]
MYDYRCKDCENLGQCMPMMNMPMNMSMMNMPMMNMPMYENYMPMCEEDDDDLKSMYPKVYIRMYPMVKHHYDIMVAKYGKMYCPGKDEMNRICKEISDKYKDHHRSNEDGDDDCNDNNMRQRGRYGGGIQDLARILLIGSLIGGRNNYGW